MGVGGDFDEDVDDGLGLDCGNCGAANVVYQRGELREDGGKKADFVGSPLLPQGIVGGEGDGEEFPKFLQCHFFESLHRWGM